ncbi:MAG: AraC family transcriptional regulator [Verrucomicrobiota bacterium]
MKPTEDSKKLERITENFSAEESNYQSTETSLGTFWRSAQDLKEPMSYTADLPHGIHLGAGIADIASESPEIGSCKAAGPMVAILSCPAGSNTKFRTTVGAGISTSCGLHIAPGTRGYDSPLVQKLLKHLPSNNPFYSANSVPRSVIERLCEPFEIWPDNDALSLAIEARVYDLLAVLTQSLHAKQPAKNLRASEKVEHARTIIETHMNETLSLGRLAKEVGLNTRSLTSYFRQAYGVSILQYLTDCRMAKGLKLLEDGFTVSEVAYQIGYSLPYFSQQFRKRHGVAASSIKPS